MTYPNWLASVSGEITQEVLWRMEVYRLSLFAGHLAWHDAGRLMQDRRTLTLSGRLYSAVASISANIAEGCSGRTHKDQARFYEDALGSTREARRRCFEGRHVLADPVASHRLSLMAQIIKHLLNIIPSERDYAIKEESPLCFTNVVSLDADPFLTNVPMAETALGATRNT